MKKIAVLSCIVGLVAASTQSFAAVRVVRFINGRKIIETIDQKAAWARRAAKRPVQSVKPRKPASVPSGYYRTRVAKRNVGKVANAGLQYVRPNMKKPAQTSVVARGVERAVAQAEQLQVKPPVAAEELVRSGLSTAWKENGGKMLYDDQIKLVRDVVAFYEKQGLEGQRVAGPDGLELVRYDLPREKMVLYRPEFDDIQVLYSDRDFILYDPSDNYGQVASLGTSEMVTPVK